MKQFMKTPVESGYTMAPDWALHSRVWMAWPCRTALWRDGLEMAKDAYCDIAKLISQYAPVTMVANPADVAECSLHCGMGVGTLSVPHMGCSMRALGPGFLTNGLGDVAAVDWRGVRPEDGSELSDSVAGAVISYLDMPRFKTGLQLDGGAVDVDGEGTALVSEQYFRDMNRQTVEAELARLGVRTVIWLSAGVEGDMTGGHVQNVARFLRPGVVAVAAETDTTQRNYIALRSNIERLRAARDAKGRPLTVIELPQPTRKVRPDGTAIAVSYTQMFIGEKLILIPAFEDGRKDQAAYDHVVGAALDKTVVSIPAVEIAYGGGGLNAITLPQPAGEIAVQAVSC